MTLRKQLNVLPSNNLVTVVEGVSEVLKDTAGNLMCLKDENIVYLSAFVVRVYPMGADKCKILIKKKKEI